MEVLVFTAAILSFTARTSSDMINEYWGLLGCQCECVPIEHLPSCAPTEANRHPAPCPSSISVQARDVSL